MTKYAFTTQKAPKKTRSIAPWLTGVGSRIAVIGTIAILSVVYIIESSTVSVKGYDMSDLERQVATLKQENQRLEVHIAEARSIGSVEKRLASLDMVPARDSQYITLVGTAMARR